MSDLGVEQLDGEPAAAALLDLSHPRVQPGCPLRPHEMSAFVGLHLRYNMPLPLDEQAGIRATYRRVALRDGLDDCRPLGKLHTYFLATAQERNASWEWSIEDLDVTVRLLSQSKHLF